MLSKMSNLDKTKTAFHLVGTAPSKAKKPKQGKASKAKPAQAVAQEGIAAAV